MSPWFSFLSNTGRAWWLCRPWARLCLSVLLGLPIAAQAFDFDDVAARAAALAGQPAMVARSPLPPALAALDYDGHRDIRFRPDRAFWRRDGLPFELQFFHRGAFATDGVRLNQVVEGRVLPIGYDAADYDFGRNRLEPGLWGDLGHAGFRVHTALNSAAYKDELIVFLGASYFRALGRGQHHGLSARALAIDTAGAPAGQREEFPRFTEFWIERPALGAERLRIYALLESARVTGAYEFTVTPGEATTLDVRSRVHLRAGATAPATLGIAPLTSMFLHGEIQPRPGDFRPEVHDSDGLAIVTGDGEWLWRPLQNPSRPLVTSFAMRSPKGFGLLQRDRAFTSYEDTEARYDRRPSAWIETLGDWGAGRVELVLLPTPDETNDNIVAYWVPERRLGAASPLELRYRVHWQGDRWQRPPTAWALQSRTGGSYTSPAADERQFTVDFTGPALAALAAGSPVRAIVTADTNGAVVEAHAFPFPADLDAARAGAGQNGPRWRLSLRVRQRDPSRPVELRAFLAQDHHALTETWTHVIPPR